MTHDSLQSPLRVRLRRVVVALILVTIAGTTGFSLIEGWGPVDSPSVVDFLDVVMHSGQLELWLEEVRVRTDGALEGKTVAECDLRGRTGINVLALRRREKDSVVISPRSDLRLEAGDVLIALGTRNQLEPLSRLAASVG
jgi:hypothetical protein